MEQSLNEVGTTQPHNFVTLHKLVASETTTILMVAMSFSSLMQICMNSFGISTVTTYISSSTPTIHVSRTYLVATVGDIASSLDIKSLCLLPPATFLPFRVPSLSSLRKIWDSRIVFLCYFVKKFLCRGTNVSLKWSCFIYDWTSPIPFLYHFLRPSLSEI